MLEAESRGLKSYPRNLHGYIVKITFDSNAWEQIFDPDWAQHVAANDIETVRAALSSNTIQGFICATTLQLEAIAKNERSKYIAQQKPEMRPVGITERRGRPYIKFSVGPNDTKHPGLHPKQLAKLQMALTSGIKFIDGNAWLSLPGPNAKFGREHYVKLTPAERNEKENRQHEVFFFLSESGVGKRIFDELVRNLEQHSGWPVGVGGWGVLGLVNSASERKRVSRAVAEWCDAEIISAHYGYCHDVVCTLDRASGSGRSVFDETHRACLADRFGIRCASISELAQELRNSSQFGWS